MAKSILITGASSEVGRAIALEIADADTLLALHYHHHQNLIADLQQAVSSRGATTLAMRYDLTDAQQAKALVEDTIRQFGRLDAVVNVVGPFQYQAITETSPEEWQETIALNLHTCFNLTHYALPYLCESKGHIVNFAFAGVENIKAWPMSAAYCAAKTGIAVLTKSWATALAAKGVRVNAICPGLVEEGTATEAERKAMAEQIPLGRPVRPQEVAATVKWLLTDSPASMTGSLLAVSGAWEY